MFHVKHHHLVQDLFNVLLSTGYAGTVIQSVSHNKDKIRIELLLPYHVETADFEELLPNIKEEYNATDFKVVQRAGKYITVDFGKTNLSDVPFNTKYIHMDTLEIVLPSAFGECILDFADGSSCHMLNGGTTRMGKTYFLLYVCTMLYVQSRGEIGLFISTTKPKDFYPFEGLAKITKSQDEMSRTLDMIVKEYQRRDTLLNSPDLAKATDAKSVREKYPHMYKHFKPIFVVIDEYARFSDNSAIQDKVIELVETAGYVNVHIIIATQRPDGRTVLSPRIKANLLARICFTTTDSNNSILILDKEGAEKLGRKAGRAIYSDGEFNIIQVPELSYETAEALLNPFKGVDKHDDKLSNKSTQGHHDSELTEKIQSMYQKPVSPDGIQGKQQSNKRMQSNNEKTHSGWFRLANPKGTGKDISLHSKTSTNKDKE